MDLLLCGQTFLYRKETARQLAERAELRDQAGVAGTDTLLPQPASAPKAGEAAAESLLPARPPPTARHYDEESELDSR